MIKCSIKGTKRSFFFFFFSLTHTYLNVCYLNIYVCVCVYVGQSPYHDNDQGVLVSSNSEPCGATQAFIRMIFTHTNTHWETQSCNPNVIWWELNVMLPPHWITWIPLNPYNVSKAAHHWYSSSRLVITYSDLNTNKPKHLRDSCHHLLIFTTFILSTQKKTLWIYFT